MKPGLSSRLWIALVLLGFSGRLAIALPPAAVLVTTLAGEGGA
jgi:hypothetical protein